MNAQVHTHVDGHVATLVLDDVAKKNAMTEALGDALQAAVTQLRKSQDVRAVVVAGAGGSFSAGGDLAMLERLRTLPFAQAEQHMRSFYARYLSLLDVEVPVIAAVQGPAIGAGACVAAACDLIVVEKTAKIAFNFVSLGLHPGMGATFLLPRKVGAQRASELLSTGRRFDGAEAGAIGFACDVVDDAKARAIEIAKSIAKQGPESVRALKKSLALDRAELDKALAREAHAQAHSYASGELGEGLRAIAEKRAPFF